MVCWGLIRTSDDPVSLFCWSTLILTSDDPVSLVCWRLSSWRVTIQSAWSAGDSYPDEWWSSQPGLLETLILTSDDPVSLVCWILSSWRVTIQSAWSAGDSHLREWWTSRSGLLETLIHPDEWRSSQPGPIAFIFTLFQMYIYMTIETCILFKTLGYIHCWCVERVKSYQRQQGWLCRQKTPLAWCGRRPSILPVSSVSCRASHAAVPQAAPLITAAATTGVVCNDAYREADQPCDLLFSTLVCKREHKQLPSWKLSSWCWFPLQFSIHIPDRSILHYISPNVHVSLVAGKINKSRRLNQHIPA